jgi:antagonist of KipI
MIVVEKAPPYLAVQDAGRPGYRASGVPRSGAMDQWSLAIANIALGNQRDAAALEWAIAGGSLRFDADTVIALTGSRVEATIDGVDTGTRLFSVSTGQTLAIERLIDRRFLYIAVRGGIECRPVLGSRSTYLPAALGGIDGRRLARGDRVPVADARARVSEPINTNLPIASGPDYDADVIRFVGTTARGDAISGDNYDRAVTEFVATSYAVSPASDRTGYRLDGAAALESAGASITSEPVCAGTIQLPPNGHPIVLMADSPTIGGYRILGTIISCDLPILAQCVPGRRIRFESVLIETAQEEIRRRETALAELERAVVGKIRLKERVRSEGRGSD